MTDERLAEKYAALKQCAHCMKPQNCPGEEDCSDFDEVKHHFLTGLRIGRDRAETDLEAQIEEMKKERSAEVKQRVINEIVSAIEKDREEGR